MNARTALVALTFLASMGAPRVVHAEPPKTPAALPTRNADVTLEGKYVLFGTAFRDVVDAEIARKLANGLPTVIVLRSWVFREGGGDPIAMTAKSCRIVFDLWDEVFRLQITQPGGQSDSVAVNLEGVLRQCAEAKKLRLVDRSELDGNMRYFVASLVEVNPISPEMLDRIKRWVSRPNGTTGVSKTDSLFGSFVGLFVPRIGDADRKLSFRSAAFSPPNQAAPEKK